MRILGAILVVGALVGGGILLSDSVPSYFKNGDNLARAEKRAEEAIAAGDVRAAEGEVDTMVSIKEVRQRRLIETAIASGGMVLLIGVGIVLFRRSGKKAKDPVAVARAA